MKEKEKEYKVAGESVYKSDLSRRTLKRLNKKLVNRFIGASPKEKEEIAGEWILTKKSLATILQIELDEKEVTETVIKEILFNPNFNAVNEKIWKRLSESENDGIRRISAMSKMATGKRLVEMLKKELEGECNEEVIIEILRSSYFVKVEDIDDETWETLSESENSEIRRRIALCYFNTAERFIKMLKKELRRSSSNYTVICTIFDNYNFRKVSEIDEETWKGLSENENWRIRRFAVQSRFATAERLQEMLNNEENADVIEAIHSNPIFKNDEEASS